MFIDIDKLDAGAFDQKLIDSVRMAKHFVLILSPNALDRCIDDNERKDWIHKVRRFIFRSSKSAVAIIRRLSNKKFLNALVYFSYWKISYW